MLQKKNIWFIIIAAAVVSFAFFPSLNNGFVNWDDPAVLTANPDITHISIAAAGKIFSSSYMAHYTPLVMLSYAAEYRLFGLNPFGYHVDSLLLHLANVLLVFALILMLTRDRMIAFAAAVIWGIHPLKVESVAWIAERKDTLSTFFLLASMISYVGFQKRNTARLYWCSLLFFTASLFSKAMGVTLPFLLLLFDYYRRGSISRKDVLNKIPFLPVSLAFGAVILHVTPVPKEAGAHQLSNPVMHGLVNAGSGLLFYLEKFFFPFDLSAFYPYSGKRWIDFFTSCPGLTAATIVFVIASVFLLRRDRRFIFGSLFFLIALAPVLQFMPFSYGLPADRYLYVPSLGLSFILGALAVTAFRAVRPRGRIALAAVFSVILITMAAATNRRCLVWHDSIGLWSNVIESSPNVPKPYFMRARGFAAAGDHGRAIADYTRGISLAPSFADAYSDRGITYASQGDLDSAVKDFTTAISLKNDFLDAYRNRAIAYGSQKKFSLALRDAEFLKLHQYPVNRQWYESILEQADREMPPARVHLP